MVKFHICDGLIPIQKIIWCPARHTINVFPKSHLVFSDSICLLQYIPFAMVGWKKYIVRWKQIRLHTTAKCHAIRLFAMVFIILWWQLGIAKGKFSCSGCWALFLDIPSYEMEGVLVKVIVLLSIQPW